MKKKKQTKRVSVSLSTKVLRIIDAEVGQLRLLGQAQPTRSSAITSLLLRNSRDLLGEDASLIYQSCLREAGPLKMNALAESADGNTAKARKAWLRAGMLELAALIALQDPDDTTIIRHLIEIVVMLKEGTGFASLPDSSRRRPLISMPKVFDEKI